jgi:hypothetical protein
LCCQSVTAHSFRSVSTCAEHFTIHEHGFHLTIICRLTLHPTVFYFYICLRWHFVLEYSRIFYSVLFKVFLVRHGKITLFLTVCRLVEELPGSWIITQSQSINPRQYISVVLVYEHSKSHYPHDTPPISCKVQSIFQFVATSLYKWMKLIYSAVL